MCPRYLSHCLDGDGRYSLVKVLGVGCNVETLFNFIKDVGILKDFLTTVYFKLYINYFLLSSPPSVVFSWFNTVSMTIDV